MNNNFLQTVIVNESSKITYSNGIITFEKKEEKTNISINSIDSIFLPSSPSSIISTKVLYELSLVGIPVIFLDEKHLPAAQLFTIYGINNTEEIFYKQLSWTRFRCVSLSDKIIRNKIEAEEKTLYTCGKTSKNIFKFYLDNYKRDDILNYEGIAAKRYFHILFGENFVRYDADNEINSYLNYGYSLIASYISSEIVRHGYKTELGIHHSSKSNHYNLTYDFIEPFRSIVDEFVLSICEEPFSFESKIKLHDIFNRNIYVNKKQYGLKDGISEFIVCCFKYLNSESNIYPKVEYVY